MSSKSLEKMRKDFKKADENKVFMYTALGIVFGAILPLNAYAYELYKNGLSLSLDNILFIHEQNFILYIFDIAPLFFGFLNFITGKKQQEAYDLTQKQHELLSKDLQTGLLNQYSSKLILDEYKEMLSGGNGYISASAITIRNLHKITSIMGVNFEAQIIVHVADYIKSLCDYKRELFRVGQNEFVMILHNSMPDEILTKISAHFKKPQKILNINCIVELSIGVAYSSREVTSPEIVLDNAMCAMNTHKNMKQKPFMVYNISMKTNYNFLEVESELHYAFQKKEFYLVYQPVVDAKTQEIHGYEALIRWKSPVFGNVSPGVFVPLLEKGNLINDVGTWIIKEACKRTRYLQEKYRVNLFVSINVSINQFFDVEFIDTLNQIVSDIGINKETIRLEITESVPSGKRDYVRDIMQTLNQNNYKLSIDDFGTGYSSLYELDNMNLYCLKIDKSFVDKITPKTPNSPVIEAIISMAKSLGLKIIVEGVENEFQYLRLRSLGCDYIQGYYFFKPLTFAHLDKVLSDTTFSEEQIIYL